MVEFKMREKKGNCVCARERKRERKKDKKGEKKENGKNMDALLNCRRTSFASGSSKDGIWAL